MNYIAILTLVVAISGMVVAVRSAMLSYRLHADAIRREAADRVQDYLARTDRAKVLLEYINSSGLDVQGQGRLELPSLTEIEASLRDFSSRHRERSNSEVIGMRTIDFGVLQSIRDPLLAIERRIDAFSVIVGTGNAGAN